MMNKKNSNSENNTKYIIDSEFKGIAGVKAYHAALTLIRSLYYLPMICTERDYFKAIEWFELLPDDEKRKVLKVAIQDGAMMNEEEINAILIFAKDQNSVPVGKEAIKNLTAFEINDILLDVVCEIFNKKVFFYQTTK